MMGGILVTGANGFLARHILARLKSTGSLTIVGADLQPYPRWPDFLHHYERLDIRNIDACRALVVRWRPSRIYHLAGLNKGPALDLLSVNALGSIGFLEVLQHVAPASRILLIGSAAEYGAVATSRLPVKENEPCSPTSVYGVSKYAATVAAREMVRRTGSSIMIARLFNLVGAGISCDLVVGAFLQKVRNALHTQNQAPVVTMGCLDAVRDYLAAGDAAEGCVQLMERGSPGEVVNICSGIPTAVSSIISTLCTFAPRPIHVKTPEASVNSHEVSSIYGDPSRAITRIGFEHRTPLEQALKAAWDGYSAEDEAHHEHP